MPVKTLALWRDDRCADCAQPLPAGTRASWDSDTRTVQCISCASAAPDVAAAPGSTSEEVLVPLPREAASIARGGGASAQREYERRHTARDQRVRSRHPKIGGLLLALVPDPSTTKVWAQGAAGEQAVANRLEQLENAVVLNDRRMHHPDGRLSPANIDHIAITPTEVWVIDAKTHHGKLEVRRAGGQFTPRTELLYINGRDQTKLLDGLARQTDAVRAALTSTAHGANVRGALCFVGTELPWLDEDIAGIPLRGPGGLLKLLRRAGPLDASQRDDLAARLQDQLPPA